MNYEPGYLKPTENKVIRRHRESWEISPDGLTDHDEAAPGREVAQQGAGQRPRRRRRRRHVQLGPLRRKGRDRGVVVNAANPNAPVLSMTATDARTIVIKLKEPLVYALAHLSLDSLTGEPMLMPKETDTSFDLRSDMIGTGPFVLEQVHAVASASPSSATRTTATRTTHWSTRSRCRSSPSTRRRWRSSRPATSTSFTASPAYGRRHPGDEEETSRDLQIYARTTSRTNVAAHFG